MSYPSELDAVLKVGDRAAAWVALTPLFEHFPPLRESLRAVLVTD